MYNETHWSSRVEWIKIICYASSRGQCLSCHPINAKLIYNNYQRHENIFTASYNIIIIIIIVSGHDVITDVVRVQSK